MRCQQPQRACYAGRERWGGWEARRAQEARGRETDHLPTLLPANNRWAATLGEILAHRQCDQPWFPVWKLRTKPSVGCVFKILHVCFRVCLGSRTVHTTSRRTHQCGQHLALVANFVDRVLHRGTLEREYPGWSAQESSAACRSHRSSRSSMRIFYFAQPDLAGR